MELINNLIEILVLAGLGILVGSSLAIIVKELKEMLK